MSIRALRAHKIVTVSTTSWKSAPIIAGITPKLAISIRTKQIAMPIKTDWRATLMVSLEMATALPTRLKSSFKTTASADSLAAVEP